MLFTESKDSPVGDTRDALGQGVDSAYDVSASREVRTGPVRGRIESPPVMVPPAERIARPRPRRQLDLHGVDLSKVFVHPVEIFFAQFAQPGASVTLGACTEELKDDFYDSIEEDIFILSSDSKLIADLKRIVAGVKQESAARMAGGATFEEIHAWLLERQKMEAEYRKSIVEGPDSLSSKNIKLRSMGLKEIESEKNDFFGVDHLRALSESCKIQISILEGLYLCRVFSICGMRDMLLENVLVKENPGWICRGASR